MPTLPALSVCQSAPIILEKEPSAFSVANLLFGGGHLCRDRFNLLNKYSSLRWIDSVDPIPEIPSESMKNLIDKRAQDFLGKSVAVQWSGGVDSTCILLALIKNGVKKDDMEIYHSHESTKEFPQLYTWLKDQGYNLIEPEYFEDSLGQTQADVITNGWCADQLFGSIAFAGENSVHYYETIPEYLKLHNILNANEEPITCDFAAEDLIKFGKDVFDLDLTIAAELGWLINFTCKWTWVSTYNELYLCNTPNRSKTDVFFNTPYFQGWALGNFHNIKEGNIYGDNPAIYKRPFKEYINEIFPCQEYLDKKSKQPSWMPNAIKDLSKRQVIVVKDESGYYRYTLAPKHIRRSFSMDLLNSIFTKYYK